MSDFDIEAIRAEVRAMEFIRGTPEEVAEWREADVESRANLRFLQCCATKACRWTSVCKSCSS
jgi:hypothetical protein